MSLFILTDTLDNVSSFISYIDLISFTIAFPDIRNYVFKSKYNMKKIIDDRLKEIFGEKVDEVIANLIKFNNIISGSFILQCLYNVSWDGSDIDIYCLNNKSSYYYHEIEPVNFKDPEDKYQPKDLSSLGFLKYMSISGLKCTKFNECITRYSYMSILASRKYQFNTELEINHIIISNKKKSKAHKIYENFYSFIEYMFDLDICKNYYDGKHVYIYDIHGLLYRRAQLSLNINKYVENYDAKIGYKSLSEISQMSKDHLMERYQKYIDRGFKIEIVS